MTGGPESAHGVVVGDLAALLHAYDCADLDELSALVDADSEPDVWVAEADGGIEVGSGTGAIVLDYPFPLADLHALVDEVAGAEAARLEKVGF